MMVDKDRVEFDKIFGGSVLLGVAGSVQITYDVTTLLSAYVQRHKRNTLCDFLRKRQPT